MHVIWSVFLYELDLEPFGYFINVPYVINSQAELEHLFSESNTVEYIQTLRETILAAAEAQTPPPPSFEEVAQSREKLKETVKYLIPGKLI